MPDVTLLSSILAVGVFVLFLALLLRWARRGAAAARARLAEIAAGRSARRQSQANTFGLRSEGAAQLRGLGYLALFDDELVFVQAIASNHVRTKVADITGVTTPRSFLGKTQGVRLLAVEWRTGDTTDQVALRVPELDAWLDELRRAGVPVISE
jgi:hypothetical protein